MRTVTLSVLLHVRTIGRHALFRRTRPKLEVAIALVSKTTELLRQTLQDTAVRPDGR